MPPFLRVLTVLLAVAVLAPAPWAQNDRDDDDDDEAIVIHRDGRIVIRDEDGTVRHFEFDGAHPVLSDTTVDGRRIIRFRMPDGDERTLDFRVPDLEHFEFDHEDFEADLERFHHGMERFRRDMEDFDGPRRFRFREGTPLGGLWTDGVAGLAERLGAFPGISEETRREMRQLERRTRELAARYRRAAGAERAEAERELDEALGRLFELRGQARAEAADHLDEQAERLRERADELREALRDRNQRRRALIDERKRELTGERGSDW